MRSFKRLFAVPFLIAFCASVAHAEWGNLTGRFDYDGPVPPKTHLPTNGKDQAACGEKILNESLLVDAKTGAVSNIVVYLRTKDVKVHPDYEATAKAEVKLVMEHCRIEPHIILIRVGQTLVGDNKDSVGHNTNVNPPAQQVTCALLPAGGPIRETFNASTALPFGIVCNIHPWMKGFVLCRDNPYVAVSKPNGSFEIQKLPAGELEFQFWHEEAGFLPAKPGWLKGRATFTIKAGETTDWGEIKLDPKLFSLNKR